MLLFDAEQLGLMSAIFVAITVLLSSAALVLKASPKRESKAAYFLKAHSSNLILAAWILLLVSIHIRSVSNQTIVLALMNIFLSLGFVLECRLIFGSTYESVSNFLAASFSTLLGDRGLLIVLAAIML